ncbi:MAG: hypothetical protein R2798_12400 [Chitinophagales bacterium]|nr:hypothetical protein [Bacteroidota bacterium]MCB9043050.1 hypothetical protein [Chitinophagales bacterium]
MKKLQLILLYFLLVSLGGCFCFFGPCCSNYYDYIVPLRSNYLQESISLNDTLSLSMAFSELYDTLHQQPLPLEDFARTYYFLVIKKLDTVEDAYLYSDGSAACFSTTNEIQTISYATDIENDSISQHKVFFGLYNDGIKLDVKLVFSQPGNYFMYFTEEEFIHEFAPYDGGLFDFENDCYEQVNFYFQMNEADYEKNNIHLIDSVENESLRGYFISDFKRNGGFCINVTE